MECFTKKSIATFFATVRTGVVLVGDDGEATMNQAEEFALLWADCQRGGHNEVRFGCADVDATPFTQRLASGKHLPTVLLIREGKVVCRWARHSLREEIHQTLLFRPLLERENVPFAA